MMFLGGPLDHEPDVRKIAVLRANGIGDFIFALPALEALRSAYPQAEITLLARPWHAEFLAHRPGPVDRVVVIPHYYGVRDEPDNAQAPAELDCFFVAMADEQFDIAIQMHGGGRHSNPFVLRLGARLTVGLKGHDAPPLDRWVPYIYFQHEVLRYLEVVSLIGATPTVLEPRLSVTDADLTESLAVVPDTGLPLVAIHPGAGDPRRHWPAEKFAAVGDGLAAAGACVVVTGAEPERRTVDSVIGGMKAPATNLCGQLSLGGLAGLLSRCQVVVSNDSGPLHLAAAVGVPTVGIFWCGNLINCGQLTRARHRPFLSWRLNCPACGANTIEARCDHTASFVADVPVEDVLVAACELFAETAFGAPAKQRR